VTDFPTPPGRLVAAERQCCVEDGVTVHPYGVRPVAARATAVPKPRDRRLQRSVTTRVTRRIPFSVTAFRGPGKGPIRARLIAAANKHARPRKGDQSRAGAGFQSAEPAEELAPSTRARTCSEESPARHTSDHGYRDEPATNGPPHRPGHGRHARGRRRTLVPRCCSANSAGDQHPEPIEREQLGGHCGRGPSVARPIPTSGRPSTGRQDRHNLELGPVGPAGQALLAAGRVRLDCDGDIGRTDADPARSARRGEVPASAQWCVDGGDDAGLHGALQSMVVPKSVD